MERAVRISEGSLRLVAQLEIAKAGNLDFLAARQRGADFLKKEFDDFFGIVFAYFADFIDQNIGQFCFC